MSRKYPAQKRHRGCHRIELTLGHLLAHARIKIGFDRVHGSVFRKVAVINFSRMLCIGAILCVKPPIASNEIHAAIPVKIGGRDAVPPAGQIGEGRGTRAKGRNLWVPGQQLAVIISENFQWPPFTGEN